MSSVSNEDLFGKALGKVFGRLPKDVVLVIFKHLPLRMAALYLPYCHSDGTAGRFACPASEFIGNDPDGTDLIEWPTNPGRQLQMFEWLEANKLTLEGRSVRILPVAHITHVGPLRRVRKLDLAWCEVERISEFSGIHTLILHKCNVWDFRGLTGVRVLDLSSTDIFDEHLDELISLGGVHTLDLSGCPGILNADPLSHIRIHTLDLSWCKRLSGVGGLGGVHTLNLSYCQDIDDFSALGRVHTLNLSGTLVKAKDLEALRGVKELILNCCRYIFD